MKKAITLFTVFLFVSTTLFSQNELIILNPDWGWWDNGHPGTIEEAEFQIEPKGLYMEVGMFLTISAQGHGYSINDTLEIVLDFNLPAGSIVHDSWLWLDETTIVKADVYDISQAVEIYEDIVDRNQDPSLLYKKSNGGYQIRIFPLAGTESRKVKITFLAPAVWSETTVENWLPLDILTTSENPLGSCRIISVADPDWGQPYLIGASSFEFDSVNDPDMGLVWINEIPQNEFANPVRFVVNSPMVDDVYISKLEDTEDENFFQIAYMPPELPASPNPQNVAVLFDHESFNSHTNKTYLFEQVKANILTTFKDEDHLNLFFSNSGQVEMASPNWVPCDSSSMLQLFNGLSDPIGEGSNFTELLYTGIQFVKENGGEGELIVFSNSSSYFNYTVTLQDLLELIDEDEIKIHVVNYQTLNYGWDENWNGPDELIYSYKWFYENITQATDGTFYSTLDHGVSVWENIPAAIGALKNNSYDFDLDVNLDAGFTFDTYYQTFLGQSTNLNKPILQVGKYLGDFPMTIDFAGYNDGTFIFDSKIIEAPDISEADTLSREIWFGHLIRFLEGNASNVAEIQHVVDLSIEERVLSRYTAFLALDLTQGGEVCMYCWNYDGEIILPATDELKPGDLELEITASPNPFSEYCQIDLELKGEHIPQTLSIQIFDSTGKLVKEINSEGLLNLGTLQYTWDGKNSNGQELSEGVYYLVVLTEKGVNVTKLIRVK